MESRILEFKQKLEEDFFNRQYNEKLFSGDNYALFTHSKETHGFYMCYQTNYPSTICYNNSPNKLIKLDEEDLEYFKNKYLPRLQEEMNQQIEKIKQQYKGV